MFLGKNSYDVCLLCYYLLMSIPFVVVSSPHSLFVGF